MSVVFTSVVEFLIIAMYIGGIPVAEQDSLTLGPPHTTRVDHRKTLTLGKTNERTI